MFLKGVKYVRLGGAIKEYRIQHDMTLAEFGNLIGVQSSAVSKWETGRVSVDSLRVSQLKRLSDVLGVSPLYLAGWVDNPHWEISASAEAQRIGAAFDRAEEYPKNIVRTTLEPYMEKGQARTG